MATEDEKLAAAREALQALGADDLEEAARFVKLFWSQAALLPTPPTLGQFGVYLTADSPPEFQAQVEALIRAALDRKTESAGPQVDPPP